MHVERDNQQCIVSALHNMATSSVGEYLILVVFKYQIGTKKYLVKVFKYSI